MIAALDLSLTCTGIVGANSADWLHHMAGHRGYDFASGVIRAETRTGAMKGCDTPQSQSRAISALVDAIVYTTLRGHWNARLVYIEDRVASRGGANFGTSDLHALVRRELDRLGIEWKLVTSSAVRKLLLGSVPRKGSVIQRPGPKDGRMRSKKLTAGEVAKLQVQQAFRAAGACEAWGLDVTDALAVLNWGMADNGLPCYSQAKVE